MMHFDYYSTEMFEYCVCDYLLVTDIYLPNLDSNTDRSEINYIIRLTNRFSNNTKLSAESEMIHEIKYDDFDCQIYLEQNIYHVIYTIQDLSLFEVLLYNKILPAISVYRGAMIVHATACCVGSKYMVFCADSGVGKSTIGYFFLKNRAKLLADDNFFLHFDGNHLVLRQLDYCLKLSKQIDVEHSLWQSDCYDVLSNKIKYKLHNENCSIISSTVSFFFLKRWSDDDKIKLVQIQDKLHQEALLHRYTKGIDGIDNSFVYLSQNSTFDYIISNATFHYLYLPPYSHLDCEVKSLCENYSK